LRTGRVLIIAGSGNYPSRPALMAGEWDPNTHEIKLFTIGSDMFCNGMVTLADGRVFVVGGTDQYRPIFTGLRTTAIYDPVTRAFTPAASMKNGRWYPTVTILPDGKVMAVAGLSSTGPMNTTTEIYDPKTNTWGLETETYPEVDFYPRQHLLPDGRVFESGFNPNTHAWDPATQRWSFVAQTLYGKSRVYGTSVLLPLMPGDEKGKVMILGGGTPGAGPIEATATTEIIDFSSSPPQWRAGPPMLAPRIQLNATLLPSGQVLVSGGSSRDEDAATAVLRSELYDPVTNTMTPAAVMARPRLYHSNTILLPDATVMAMGSNPRLGDYDGVVEIYRPPYLFNDCGEPITARPIISRTPAEVTYGSTFTVDTPFPAPIQKVVLIRPGSATHAFDMDQRLIGLEFQRGNGTLSVKAPPNSRIAPPGWYLLFILDTEGTPSVGAFVQLR
jgi:hypothetical protein